MVSEVVEAPTEQAALPIEGEANQAPPQQTQTETPPAGESAVAPEGEAVASEPTQIEIAPPEAPKYMTQEEAERFWAEREEKARADEREREQNRRRTEAANEANRKARMEKRRGRLKDGITASFITTTGVAPEGAVDTAIDGAIDLAVEVLREEGSAVVDSAWEHIIAPLTQRDAPITEENRPVVEALLPKVQALVNELRPAIEAQAREGYIAESDLPARVDAEIARRNAKSREGTEELKRPEGTPASGQSELDWWRSLGPEGRRDPANIARFDRYTASQR